MTKKKENKIIIDQAKGLEFDSEDELYAHFSSEIMALEKEFFSIRPQDDISEDDFAQYEDNLNALLEEPDEIWHDTELVKGSDVAVYIKHFGEEEDPIYHVAVVYLTENMPSFVYLHFPTSSEMVVGHYRKGEKVYDRLLQQELKGAVEGDALYEGDEFAMGLYHAMLKLRSDADVAEENFLDYAHLREDTIEHPDEIWRSNDSMGNVLVTFIKDFPEENPKPLQYIVVTLEDLPSNSHALLFSFPSNDEGLIARYRHGENLQAEEVVQEASH